MSYPAIKAELELASDDWARELGLLEEGPGPKGFQRRVPNVSTIRIWCLGLGSPSQGRGQLESELQGWPPKPDPNAIYQLCENPKVCLETVSVRPFSRGEGLSKNFGSLGVRESTFYSAAKQLGLKGDELVVLRFTFLDDLKVTVVDDPEVEIREGDWIGSTAPANDPSTQFWAWGSDQKTTIVVNNPTYYCRNISRIAFTGWLIQVRQVVCPGETEVTPIRLGWE